MRDAAACQAELLALLPPGWAFARTPDSNVGRALLPLAGEMAAVEARAANLLAQIAPVDGVELLADYERLLGPDPCGRDLVLTTLAERQGIAQQRWTDGGDPTPAFFIALAAALGETVTITTPSPSRCGPTRCGQRLVPKNHRYIFIVAVAEVRVVRARAGRARCGQRIGHIVPSGIECPIRHAAPLHTAPVFSYSEAT
jgi:uncharacterized protein YmfQ (DUF2313 family)